jgi:hypothetical protein
MKSSLLLVLLSLCNIANAFGTTAAASAAVAVLKDHSEAAAGLFNNMRTPAALIAGSIIPLALITAPEIKLGDTRLTKLLKKGNMLLAIFSLLHQIIAITYSTMAINKIAELSYLPTRGVSEYMTMYHQLPWVGTNVHFLLGLFGFGCLAVAKPYFVYGKNLGHVSACWIGAAMMFCVSIVNKGISMGHGTIEDTNAKLASNLAGLMIAYAKLLFAWSKGKVLPIMAFGLMLLSFVPLKAILESSDPQDKKVA